MIEYEFHEICNEYPTLPIERLDELGDNILKYGLQQKIVLYKGKILDGKNRYLAMKQKGIEFTKDHFINLTSETLPGSYTISMNLMRRHIGSPAFRAELALKAFEFDKKLLGKEEETDEKLRKIIEKKENMIIAPAAQTNTETIRKTREIIKRAEDDPKVKEKWEKAKQGGISVKKVYNDYIKPPAKKKHGKMKKPTKLELRQAIIDKEEEIKEIRISKTTYASLWEEVKEIAKRLGYWDAIIKELIPTIERKESLFPTIKQLREAGFI